MEVEQRLRELLEVEDPGQRFTDNVMARISSMPAGPVRAGAVRIDARRRRPGRWMLWGAAFALAAAAATLALVYESRDGGAGTSSTAGVATPASGAVPVAAMSGAGQAAADTATPTPAAFTVRVAPLDTMGNDPRGIAEAEAFREDFVKQLAQVAGVRLVDGRADYEVRMYFDGLASPSSRRVKVAAGDPHVLDEMDRLASGDAKDRAEYAARQHRAVPFRPHGLEASPEGGLHTDAHLDGGRSVAQLVRTLRTQVFPLADSWVDGLLGTLRNTALSTETRMDAFNDLLTIAERRGNSITTASAQVVTAGAELALAAPRANDRRELWTQLLHTGNDVLVPYLLRGLHAEQDVTLRRWMLAQAMPRLPDLSARQMLEDLAQDADLQMRVTVRNALGVEDSSGPALLVATVAAAINDASLSDVKRLEPFAGLAESAAGGAPIRVRLEDSTIRELGEVLIRAGQDPAASGVVAKSMQVLGGLQGAAVRDVLIGILRHPEDEAPGEAKASFHTLRSKAMLVAASHFGGDETINALLQGFATAGDVNAQLALQTNGPMDAHLPVPTLSH